MPISDQFMYKLDDDRTLSLAGADSFSVAQALTRHAEIVVAQADVTTSNLITMFDDQVGVLKQTVIGTSSENLCLDRFPGQGRSSLCNVSQTYEQGGVVSNIVAKAFLTVTPTADFAIQNAGGARVDIAAGDYTIYDVFTLLPFSNTLVTLELTGQQIIDVLEEALSSGLDSDGSDGSYPYASGLRFDVDSSRVFGSRISNMEINPRLAGEWKLIDTTANYVVVTNSFLASGRDGYATFGSVFDAGNFVDTYTEYAQAFIDYVEALTATGSTLAKLPLNEYSTKSYIDSAGCNHSTTTTCADDASR